MKTQITKFAISNELDIVMAHKRSIQLCELTGISLSDKTRFATAISEICRNCLEFAREGTIVFSIDATNDTYLLECLIEDQGPGIKNLSEILKRQPLAPGARGFGILHSKKLVDFFNIESSPSGTLVLLGMKVPHKHPPINSVIVKGWVKHFEKNHPVSPYEEIKKQNMQLLDVTEELKLKNLQAENQIEEIKTLNGQLRKANNDLEEFTYTISHDLKSPISNIELLITLLNKSGNEEKSKTYIEAIGTSIQKLKNTIHGLVEIIEVQNTGEEIVKEVIFKDLYLKVEDQYQKEISELNAILYTDFNFESIKYYEAYLYSIMQNLISNSIKYRDEKRALKIEVTTRQEGEYCLLEVKDNGIGMDMNRIGKNLFKAFTRFNKNTDGKGIGLHLVRSMVEKNGGRIEVESEVGKGTIFKLYLVGY